MDLPGYGCAIVGSGSALGSHVATGAELEERLSMPRGWAVDRTGVAERRIAAPGERPTQLGVRAARKALTDARLAPTDIDLIICATMTAEMPCPATGQRIAAEIGAAPVAAFDLTSACTGYLTALHMAANCIRSGANRHVLVVGTDVLSGIVDQEDARMAVLFGDAASASVLSRVDDPNRGCLTQFLKSDGREWELIYHPQRAEDLPSGVTPPERYGLLVMNGLLVYRFAVETLAKLIPEVLSEVGLTTADADLVLLHQSNLRIIERVRAAINVDAAKCPTIIERTGNTSGGSLGLLMDDVRRAGKWKPGMNIVLGAVGGGLSWGASVWKT